MGKVASKIERGETCPVRDIDDSAKELKLDLVTYNVNRFGRFEDDECRDLPFFRHQDSKGRCLRTEWFPSGNKVSGRGECARYDDVFDYEFLRTAGDDERKLAIKQGSLPCSVSEDMRIEQSMKCCLNSYLGDQDRKLTCPWQMCDKSSSHCRRVFFEVCSDLEAIAKFDKKQPGLATDFCNSFSDQHFHRDTVLLACLDGQGGVDNVKTKFCRDFLLKDPEKSEEILKTICGERMKDDDWKDVCACYYPDTEDGIYQQFRQMLKEDKNIPVDMVTKGNPECYFPPCASSEYRRRVPKCDRVQINSCVSKATVDFSGARLNRSSFKFDAGKDCVSKIGGDVNVEIANRTSVAVSTPRGEGPSHFEIVASLVVISLLVAVCAALAWSRLTPRAAQLTKVVGDAQAPPSSVK
jgi:hypothetical protein